MGRSPAFFYVRMARRQGVYWICTVPQRALLEFPGILPDGVTWAKGQLEEGGTTGYRHWQFVVGLANKGSRATMQRIFGKDGHYELSRSGAAESYVWKDETAVDGTRFELGARPICRNAERDWDRVWECAKVGDLDGIPADIRVRCFSALTKIGTRYAVGSAVERTVRVYWGDTGTGKSRTAWEEAGLDAYPKDPRTKWWDGYQGHDNIVIDEFRGGIDIAHVLRWFDRYPVLVETKGGSVPLRATSIWITSNLDPRNWYPDLDEETRKALVRRLEIKHFVKL